MIYVDTSALVPYYCPEALSDAAQRFLASQNELAISDLEEVELFSALAKKVRAGEMGRKDAQRVRATFQIHLESGLYVRLPVERRHFATAREWLTALRPPLAALDALHLAVAAGQPCPIVTVDASLARAARAIGVAARVLR